MATLDAKEAYSDADFVVIVAPTNYDSKKNFFDTGTVEAVIRLVMEYNQMPLWSSRVLSQLDILKVLEKKQNLRILSSLLNF